MILPLFQKLVQASLEDLFFYGSVDTQCSTVSFMTLIFNLSNKQVKSFLVAVLAMHWRVSQRHLLSSSPSHKEDAIDENII